MKKIVLILNVLMIIVPSLSLKLKAQDSTRSYNFHTYEYSVIKSHEQDAEFLISRRMRNSTQTRYNQPQFISETKRQRDMREIKYYTFMTVASIGLLFLIGGIAR